MKRLDIWRKEPEEDNYRRAVNYLSLRLPSDKAVGLVDALRRRKVEWRLADDVLRASRLDALAPDDPEIRRRVTHILSGEKLHPILVVHFGMRTDIADGYHAVSLASWLSPEMGVPCVVA